MSYGPKPWQQLHWDTRAALNFMCGGTGAGLLVAWAAIAPVTHHWSWIVLAALALVGAGLTAVWLEIGRKLRAIHVFFNPWTSWMTRESFVALVLFALGIAALVLQQRALGQLAALAGLAFVYCQGRILHASKGIPAWREPAVTGFIITTALAEGAALLLIIELFAGVSRPSLTFFVLLVVVRALAWSRYRARLQRSVPKPALAALEPAGRAIMQIGTIAALALAIASAALTGPEQGWAAGTASAAALLAAVLAWVTGWYAKFVLITRAAYNQGFALPHVPVRGGQS